jgi:hypothetical protein
MISAHSGYHMEELKDMIYDKLGFIRVYLRPRAGKRTWRNPDRPVGCDRPSSRSAGSCTGLRGPVPVRADLGVFGEAPGQRVGLTHKLNDKTS